MILSLKARNLKATSACARIRSNATIFTSCWPESVLGLLQWSGRHRRGFSLLEVLVAMTIFLLSLLAISRLVSMSTDQALDVLERTRCTQTCQSKLAEVAIGAIPLSPQGETAVEEAPELTWSMECEQAEITGLWNVQVRVVRKRRDGTEVSSTLRQMILDPKLRGSSFDAQSSSTPSSGSAASTGAAPSSNQGSSSSSGSTGQNSGGTGRQGP